MGNNIVSDNQHNDLVTTDKVLKATSLLYLKDALLNQQYEECAELIRTAKKFGATPEEISRLIAEVIRTGAGSQNETSRAQQSKLRRG